MLYTPLNLLKLADIFEAQWSQYYDGRLWLWNLSPSWFSGDAVASNLVRIWQVLISLIPCQNGFRV